MKRNSLAIEQNALKIGICKIYYLSMQPAKLHAFANKRLRWWSRQTNWEVRLVASINTRGNAPHIVIISDQGFLKNEIELIKKNHVYKVHTLYSVLKMVVKKSLSKKKHSWLESSVNSVRYILENWRRRKPEAYMKRFQRKI